MKLLLTFSAVALALGVLSAPAAQPSPQHENNRSLPKSHNTSSVTTAQLAPLSQSGSKPADAAAQTTASATPAPASAAPAKSSLTLDAYIGALASTVPLSKSEQTDVKTYYQQDGAKLQQLLNDPSLSPLQQTEQVDALRDARNAHIEALLNDAGRQGEFLKLEATYRVALVELAMQGGFVPTSALPNVPEPTATSPAQADAQVQAESKGTKIDTAPGQ